MRREGVGGQITAIDGSTVTLETFRGETAKVKITSSTRLMKDGNEVKLSEFKVGDRVFASGEQDKDGVWTAQMFGQRNGGGRMGAAQARPEDNGKTYILGELIKIDGTKLTVKKPDNTEQVIEVDDDTSFRNERRESVTLADIKVGDFVRGQGSVKSGVFVPSVLNTGRPRGPRSMAPSAPSPDSAPPNQKQAAPDSNDQK
jgi:riboflavin synthase alpha subunit